jgi:hypothetical protein
MAWCWLPESCMFNGMKWLLLCWCRRTQSGSAVGEFRVVFHAGVKWVRTFDTALSSTDRPHGNPESRVRDACAASAFIQPSQRHALTTQGPVSKILRVRSHRPGPVSSILSALVIHGREERGPLAPTAADKSPFRAFNMTQNRKSRNIKHDWTKRFKKAQMSRHSLVRQWNRPESSSRLSRTQPQPAAAGAKWQMPFPILA